MSFQRCWTNIQPDCNKNVRVSDANLTINSMGNMHER